MKNKTSTYLLLTTLAIVFLTILSGLVINLLTSDTNFTEWLKENNIGTGTLVIFVILTGLALLIAAFLQFHFSDQNEQTHVIEPVVSDFFNSLKKGYEEKTGGRIVLNFDFDKNESSENENSFYENDGFVREKESDGIKIYPSEKIYVRLNSDVSEFKKEFTVRYPIVKGMETEATLHKINSAINYEKVFDISIEESLETDTWLSELDYSIRLIKFPFLIIELHMDGVAAYPSHASQNVAINLQTGNRIKIDDIFNPVAQKRLASVIDEFVQADNKKVNLQLKYADGIPLAPDTNLNEEETFLLSWIGDSKFTVNDFDDFFFDEYGITFCFNFALPHAIKVFEPEGHYYFDFSALSELLIDNSILKRFVSKNDFSGIS